MARHRKLRTFQVILLTAAPLGLVDAVDEGAAIKAAVKRYRVPAEEAQRLIAIRRA
jgi:hypothetical protein